MNQKNCWRRSAEVARLGVVGAVGLAGAGPVHADVRFSIFFDDPGGLLTAYRANIESNLLAAAATWGELLEGDADLEIWVHPGSVPRTTGKSVTSVFVGTAGGFNIFEQGAAGEVRTGIDPNGSNPDIEITLGIPYVTGQLWYDPDPTRRVATVPANRTDAVSVFLHELGHALAYNGWMDGTTGTFPGNYKSTFDKLVRFDGSNFYFEGEEAEQEYGAPVPITYGNRFHLGNSAPRPGSDLLGQLMNGVVFINGRRYYVGPLDVAILADVGVRLRPPCLADINGDGVVDFADYLEFLNLFDAHDPRVDFTQDGVVDFGDYLEFLNLFDAGC